MSEEPQTAEDFERIADEKAKQKAEGWNAYVEQYYRRAIQEGSVSAISKLADYYYLGDGNDNKKAAVLYLEAAKAKGDDCEREVSILTRMLESSWLEPEWSFFGEVLELLAENGNREAKHMIRREEVPEPTDDSGYQALLAETFELPEEAEPEKKEKRTWGRGLGKRPLTSLLYDMGIEFTRSSNGVIKTKLGFEIKDDIEKLKKMGYPFKFSYKTGKWTVMDPKYKE